MEIKIENYLDHHEIKEVVVDELRNQIRTHFQNEKNAERLLINLSYQIVSDEVEKITPNYKDMIVAKVNRLINDKDLSYHLYNFHYGTNQAISLGAKYIEEAVNENKQLIKDKVLSSIMNKDYSDEAWNKLEHLAEDFTSNIYNFIETIRNFSKNK